MDNLKNIIVLKDLPSNIIDEAFIILKPNSPVKNIQYTANSKKSNTPNISNDYIIKEAESVLHSFISKLEKPISPKNQDLEKKYKRLKIISLCILGFALFSFFFNLI